MYDEQDKVVDINIYTILGTLQYLSYNKNYKQKHIHIANTLSEQHNPLGTNRCRGSSTRPSFGGKRSACTRRRPPYKPHKHEDTIRIHYNPQHATEYTVLYIEWIFIFRTKKD